MSAQRAVPPAAASSRTAGALIAALVAGAVLGAAGVWVLVSAAVPPARPGRRDRPGPLARRLPRRVGVRAALRRHRLRRAPASATDEAAARAFDTYRDSSCDEIVWTPDGKRVGFLMTGQQLVLYDAQTLEARRQPAAPHAGSRVHPPRPRRDVLGKRQSGDVRRLPARALRVPGRGCGSAAVRVRATALTRRPRRTTKNTKATTTRSQCVLCVLGVLCFVKRRAEQRCGVTGSVGFPVGVQRDALVDAQRLLQHSLGAERSARARSRRSPSAAQLGVLQQPHHRRRHRLVIARRDEHAGDSSRRLPGCRRSSSRRSAWRQPSRRAATCPDLRSPSSSRRCRTPCAATGRRGGSRRGRRASRADAP